MRVRRFFFGRGGNGASLRIFFHSCDAGLSVRHIQALVVDSSLLLCGESRVLLSVMFYARRVSEAVRWCSMCTKE